MAHFRATIRGSRGEASRLGGKDAGLTVTADGWNVGVRVDTFYDKETGKDLIRVYKTGGSNARTSAELIATVVEE